MWFSKLLDVDDRPVGHAEDRLVRCWARNLLDSVGVVVLDALYVCMRRGWDVSCICMRRGWDVCAVFLFVGPPAGITCGPCDGHATGMLGTEEWIVLC